METFIYLIGAIILISTVLTGIIVFIIDKNEVVVLEERFDEDLDNTKVFVPEYLLGETKDVYLADDSEVTVAVPINDVVVSDTENVLVANGEKSDSTVSLNTQKIPSISNNEENDKFINNTSLEITGININSDNYVEDSDSSNDIPKIVEVVDEELI